MKKKVIASLLAMFIGGIAVFAQDPMVDKKNTDSKPPYIYPEESIVRENIEKWQDMKFGMFICWSLSTFSGNSVCLSIGEHTANGV